MAKLNALAGIGLGLYLILVVWHGNTDKLLLALAEQKDFVKWAVALSILLYIADESKSAVAEGFVTMALIAMALNAAGTDGLNNILDQVNLIFGSQNQ